MRAGPYQGVPMRAKPLILRSSYFGRDSQFQRVRAWHDMDMTWNAFAEPVSRSKIELSDTPVFQADRSEFGDAHRCLQGIAELAQVTCLSGPLGKA